MTPLEFWKKLFPNARLPTQQEMDEAPAKIKYFERQPPGTFGHDFEKSDSIKNNAYRGDNFKGTIK